MHRTSWEYHVDYGVSIYWCYWLHRSAVVTVARTVSDISGQLGLKCGAASVTDPDLHIDRVLTLSNIPPHTYRASLFRERCTKYLAGRTAHCLRCFGHLTFMHHSEGRVEMSTLTDYTSRFIS